jgi:dsRNA-specific ribonuclease
MDTSKYLAFAKVKFGGFDDINLLITAFTHRSYLNEHKKTAQEHNERLEFLGDAVLELVVTEYLYNSYSEPEGILTNWRSALVRLLHVKILSRFLDLVAEKKEDQSVPASKSLPTAMSRLSALYILKKAMTLQSSS